MIKSCILIERLNSLTLPSGVTNCRNLPSGGGDMRLMGAPSKKGKHAESPPIFILGKRRKNQNGKGRGSVYYENEGSGVIYTRGRYYHPTRPSQGTAASNRLCES